jgi:prolyl-tRNA editing enzyme YbaK/EbsC (Cys-tRNA(Pro) deacylase)
VVTRAWPEPVERVAAFLRSSAAEARIEEFPEGTPTAEAAAKAVGCELAEIVKSLVFSVGGRFVLVLVPGDRRADARKVAEAAGAPKARVASPEEVEAATGFAPGAVAPFPLRRIDAVLIERTLLTHQRVWIGAGSERHMAGLAPADLVRLARARPIDAVEARI